jgi:hypothetical protein
VVFLAAVQHRLDWVLNLLSDLIDPGSIVVEVVQGGLDVRQ